MQEIMQHPEFVHFGVIHDAGEWAKVRNYLASTHDVFIASYSRNGGDNDTEENRDGRLLIAQGSWIDDKREIIYSR